MITCAFVQWLQAHHITDDKMPSMRLLLHLNELASSSFVSVSNWKERNKEKSLRKSARENPESGKGP